MVSRGDQSLLFKKLAKSTDVGAYRVQVGFAYSGNALRDLVFALASVNPFQNQGRDRIDTDQLASAKIEKHSAVGIPRPTNRIRELITMNIFGAGQKLRTGDKWVRPFAIVLSAVAMNFILQTMHFDPMVPTGNQSTKASNQPNESLRLSGFTCAIWHH